MKVKAIISVSVSVVSFSVSFFPGAEFLDQCFHILFELVDETFEIVASTQPLHTWR
jgi:hypothetical protein